MPTFSITDYGAVGDGKHNDARAIQQAIDTCHAAGGGTVLVPAGRTYVAGSFELKSNMRFHVESGAVLLGATEEADYPLFAFTTGAEAGKRLWIGAKHAQNIVLDGGGVIDGNCLAFSLEEGPYGHPETQRWRPAMTCFEDCRNLRIQELTLRNAANWALHFSGCEDIVVHGISILNDLKFPNCDGIDPDHCRNVRISDCHIEAGDDCIVLKNTEPFAQYGPCENITVNNCTLISTSSAIKIGTESCDDFRNLTFTNCNIFNSNRGLSIHLRDCGSVENVIFSNMTVQTRFFHEGWWGSGEVIYVTALPRTHATKVGTIRNVLFSNLFCRGENGIYLHGLTPGHIQNVTIDQLDLELVKSSRWPAGCYDTRPCPPDLLPLESTPIGNTSLWGCKSSRKTPAIYLQNASDVALRNCTVRWGQDIPETYTHALEAHALHPLRLQNFRGHAAKDTLAPCLVQHTELIEHE